MSRRTVHMIKPPGNLPTDPSVCGDESRDGSEMMTTEARMVTCPACIDAQGNPNPAPTLRTLRHSPICNGIDCAPTCERDWTVPS